MIFYPVIANAGIPMIALQMPFMVFALIPIILIEGYLIAKMIQSKPGRIFGATISANLVSTFLGVPIAWGFMLLINMITTGGSGGFGGSLPIKILGTILAASWLAPFENDLYWMIPFAMMVLLIPSFVVSVYSERWIFYLIYRHVERSLIKRSLFRANFATYGILLFLNVIWLVISILNTLFAS